MKIQRTRVNESWMSPWSAWPLVWQWREQAGDSWLTFRWKWQSLECRRLYHICLCLHLGGVTVRALTSLWIRSASFFFIRTEVFWGFTCSLSLAACPDETLITQLQSNLSCSQKISCVLGYGQNTLSVMAKTWNSAVHYFSWHRETCKE